MVNIPNKKGRPKGSGTAPKQGQRAGRTYPLRSVGIDDERWAICLSKPQGVAEYIRTLIDADNKTK